MRGQLRPDTGSETVFPAMPESGCFGDSLRPDAGVAFEQVLSCFLLEREKRIASRLWPLAQTPLQLCCPRARCGPSYEGQKSWL